MSGGLRRSPLLAVALVATCGCTPWREYVYNGFKVGPNYRKPAAPVAADWIDAGDVRISEEPPNLQRWWTVFNDPALDALINNAVNQNLTLREAGFRVMRARAVRAATIGEIFPQTQDVAGGYSRNAMSTQAANTGFLQDRFFDEWDGGFNLGWELDFWGRYRRAIEAADADLDASIESYDAILVTLLADVAQAYVEVRTLQTQIQLVRANETLQAETLKIVSAKFSGGMVSELDVDQAKSNLAQTQALVPKFQIPLRQAELRLCILMGIPPTDLDRMIGAGDIPTASTAVAVGIPANLLAQRPDVRRAERDVAAQSARVGVAVSELYPHIGITGAIGVSAQNASNLFTSEALQGSVGPSFQWNVLNYGRLLNAIRIQDARLAELIAFYQNKVLEANAEVESGLVEFLRSQEQATFLDASVSASVRATNVALTQYEFGMIDFNRVSLIEQNLVSQQDLYAQAEGDIALGLIEIYRALGGGWQIRLEESQGPEALPPVNETGDGLVPDAPARPENLPLPAPAPGPVVPTPPAADSRSQPSLVQPAALEVGA
ncbi:MAG: efflux transporter outer membrane subunit [Planctomycetaceae bacterium]|nr:efflux transporter outer membrane subunit [Planctomycetaceae bacterium]